MTRSSRFGDFRFAIVPFLLLTVVVPPIAAICTQKWIPWSKHMGLVILVAWALAFVWWRRIDVRRLVGPLPSVRELLRWCAINSVATLLLSGAVLSLAAATPLGADLDRSLSFYGSMGDVTGMVLLAACLGPFVDVFVMQGLVLRNLLERVGPRAAVVMSAVVAALVHADPLFLLHIGSAIVLAVACLETRGLWVALAMELAGFASLLALAGAVDAFDALAHGTATQARLAWQHGPVAGVVAVLLMGWVALVAWVFLRVPRQARPGTESDGALATT